MCESIFRCKEYFLPAEEEKLRYENHNNDVRDSWYQAFVAPLVNKILINHKAADIWLDFWAGTWPVISYILWQKWFELKLYDPFFHNHHGLLKQKYDFIIACEVIEHFHNPREEFTLLYNLLKPQGKLYLMTDLYNHEVDFSSWYYKNDPTHVFFYTEKSFLWMKDYWQWKSLFQEKKCIIFEK